MAKVAVLIRIADVIDGINRLVGRVVAWMTLGLVLVAFGVVVLRYVFGIGLIQLQEAAVYQHGLILTLGAGYTLLKDGHVRVDILYGRMGERRRALVNLLGVLILLLPMCILVMGYAWPYVAQSWRILEGSREASGLPVLYVLKTGILAFAGLLAMQGIAVALRAVHYLATVLPMQGRHDG